jgi:peroxiredoxin/outer membrane lipoprotein-sorting protein
MHFVSAYTEQVRYRLHPIRVSCTLTIAFVLIAIQGGADDTAAMTGHDWIRRCASAYQRLNGVAFRVRFQQEFTESVSKRAWRAEADIRVAFREPDRFAATYMVGRDVERELICDGARCIIYRPDLKEYTETEATRTFTDISLLRTPFDLPPGTGIVFHLLHGKSPEGVLTTELQTAEVVGMETVSDRRTCIVVLSYPWDRLERGLSTETIAALKGKTARLKLWIDTENYLIRRTEIDLAAAATGFDPDGAPPLHWILTENFSELNVKPPMDPTRFVFTPPQDVRLVRVFGEARQVNDLIGQQVPDLTLTDMRGGRVRLSSFRDRAPVLLFIWSGASSPCTQVFPVIESIHKLHRGKSLVVLGISLDTRDTTREMIQKYRITFRTLIDLDVNDRSLSIAQVIRAFNVNGVPRTIIVDKDGVIRSDRLGTVSEKILSDDLESAGIRKQKNR